MFVVCAETIVILVDVVAPDKSKANCFVCVVVSAIFVVVVSKVLFVKVSVVALPTRVSVEVGNVITPVFEIVEIIGDVKVLSVST